MVNFEEIEQSTNEVLYDGASCSYNPDDRVEPAADPTPCIPLIEFAEDSSTRETSTDGANGRKRPVSPCGYDEEEIPTGRKSPHFSEEIPDPSASPNFGFPNFLSMASAQLGSSISEFFISGISKAQAPPNASTSALKSLQIGKAWAEYLARPNLFMLDHGSSKPTGGNPTVFYASYLNYSRLALQEASKLAMNSGIQHFDIAKLRSDLGLKETEKNKLNAEICSMEEQISRREQHFLFETLKLQEDFVERLTVLEKQHIEELNLIKGNHAKAMESAELRAVMEFSTSQLVDDCATVMLRPSLTAVIANFKA